MIDTKVDYGVTSNESSEPPTRPRQEYLKPDAGQRRTIPPYNDITLKILFLTTRQQTRNGTLLTLAHMLSLMANNVPITDILDSYGVNGSINYNPNSRDKPFFGKQATGLMQDSSTTVGTYALLECLKRAKDTGLDVENVLEIILLTNPDVAERFSTMQDSKRNKREYPESLY